MRDISIWATRETSGDLSLSLLFSPFHYNEVNAQARAKFFDHYLRILMIYCARGADRRRRRKNLGFLKIFLEQFFFFSPISGGG